MFEGTNPVVLELDLLLDVVLGVLDAHDPLVVLLADVSQLICEAIEAILCHLRDACPL